MKIYLQQDGQPVGPYSEEELCNYVIAGTINQFDLARHEGLNDWQPLGTIINIAATSPTTSHLPPPPKSTSGIPHLPPPPKSSFGTPLLTPTPNTTFVTPQLTQPPTAIAGNTHLPPPDIALPPPDIAAIDASRNGLVPSVLQKLTELGAVIGGWACFIIGFYILILHSWPFYIHYALFVAALLLSIEALSQRKIIAGLSLLSVTLLLPTFVGFGLLFYRANKAAEPTNDESGIIQSEQKIENQKDS